MITVKQTVALSELLKRAKHDACDTEIIARINTNKSLAVIILNARFESHNS
jgi:hypothetical protein